MILKIIAAVLVFCLLIISHEFGHFIAAKSCGVYVEDFSLGMGPKLLQIKGRETTYTLRPFPIGGWCKMRGEDEDSADPRAFNNKKVWQRMIIIAAGPLMNFICAFVIFVIIYASLGVVSEGNTIGGTTEGFPAYQVLEEGDQIVEIDGMTVDDWNDLSVAVNRQDAGDTLNIRVIRDGHPLEFSVGRVYNEEYGVWQIGVLTGREYPNIFQSIRMGCVQSVQFIVELIRVLFQAVTGQVKADVAGPVGIVSLIGDTTEQGMAYLLVLVAYLSINLGIINLLPLPALDGCRLVFLAVEAIRRKPLPREKEGMVHFIGLVLLLGLMLVITYSDIVRLVTGG